MSRQRSFQWLLQAGNWNPATENRPMNEYSDEERKILLCLAHRAIAAELRREELDTTSPSARLAEPRVHSPLCIGLEPCAAASVTSCHSFRFTEP